HFPNGGGLGRRSRPKPPPKSVKFARTLSKGQELLWLMGRPVPLPGLFLTSWGSTSAQARRRIYRVFGAAACHQQGRSRCQGRDASATSWPRARSEPMAHPFHRKVPAGNLRRKPKTPAAPRADGKNGALTVIGECLCRAFLLPGLGPPAG